MLNIQMNDVLIDKPEYKPNYQMISIEPKYIIV